MEMAEAKVTSLAWGGGTAILGWQTGRLAGRLTQYHRAQPCYDLYIRRIRLATRHQVGPILTAKGFH